MKRIIFIQIMLCILLIFICCSHVEKADMVILNGKVVTVDSGFSIREAIAVTGDRIVAVGSRAKVSNLIGKSTKIIDAEGLLVLPGLIDAHAHLVSLGNQLANLDITDCTSFQEIVETVAVRVKQAEPGEWIVGGRWDQTRWETGEFPVHDLLSDVSPENPVYLTRVDGNSAFVNRKALELAGITASTPDPVGGFYVRKPDGKPSGVLVNMAMNSVKDMIPGDTKEQLMKKLKMAVQSCIEIGLTGVHEAGVGPWEIGIIKEMIDSEKLDLRIYAMLGEQEKPEFGVDDLPEYFMENRIEAYGDGFLSVKSVKLFFDGALGSRGAAFFEPYSDDKQNSGILRIKPEYITEVVLAALETDMGVNTHCIGIRGNRLCLDAYEEALKDFPGRDHRLRIEHAQIVREEDIRKFVDLRVIPSMQPAHCTSDMHMVVPRVGEERAEFAYAWRTFLDAGLTIPCGSDFPVESNNPLLGMYAAVTRKAPGDPEGKGWHTEQCMTIEEAIRGFTIWAAHAAFQEDMLGSVEVGKYADFTILDRDILILPPEELLNTIVMYTIIGGKIRYSRDFTNPPGDSGKRKQITN